MWAILDRLHDEGRLVDLKRDRIDGTTLRGFVSGLSPDLSLLTIVRDGHFDGASIVRVEDVTSLRWGSEALEACARLLVGTPSSPETASGVDLSGWNAAFDSIAARAPVVSLHRENDYQFDDGVDVNVRDGWIEARLLRASGDVDGSVAFEVGRLTRVDFGGTYEASLWRMARERNAGSAVR